ncbi:DNA replication regulator SLD2 [Golovinomyces cichoracearum]|uniref:DNA replication regulator SLD2 n=1 Tax=Golovinomyces cichoracearum TaxID=62708 RepID=A0A420IUK9_9PEZI|nr:DNA replication regulator SLD2 [Golovinomyces cichoracearum]
MEATKLNSLIEKARILRSELKKWEKEFSAAHDGSKASRNDIRQNPEIAAKYKEYNKIKDEQNNGVLNTLEKRSTPPQIKTIDERNPIRIKQPRESFHTPSKKRRFEDEFDSYHTPSVVRNLFTPSKISLGPTPQKDGHVLGLFDLLREPESNNYSQAQKFTTSPTSYVSNHVLNVHSEEDKHCENPQQSMTASLSEKQDKPDPFSTPSKDLTSNLYMNKSPSVSKLNFSTPSFLRRDNQQSQLSTDSEVGQVLLISPQPVRAIKRRPAIRGLSRILADLRESQDESLDSELEVLREIEAEEMNVGTSILPVEIRKKKSSHSPSNFYVKDVLRDNSITVDSETLGKIQDASDQPPLTYKKRDQKRTTRRVQMKPTRFKAVPTVKEKLDYSEKTHSQDQGIISPQTGTPTSINFGDQARNFDSDSQSEYTASEGETRYRRPKNDKKSRNLATVTVVADSQGSSGGVKPTSRKVGALAHQNFKRLKIRNSGVRGAVERNKNRRVFSRKKK